jgi:hypothetical protein
VKAVSLQPTQNWSNTNNALNFSREEQQIMNRYLALASLFLISGLLLTGCLAGAANTVRVDGGMKYELQQSESARGLIHIWRLPERRSISRIEVYFDPFEPLKNFTVYAEMGKDNWRVIKEVKTPAKTSPYLIRTAVSTDAIRIVQTSLIGNVKEIALYGADSGKSEFEKIK